MTYRQLLRGNADFRRLWTGQVVSEIGDWLNNIAVLALTIELAGAGREGLAIAVYAISRHLPLFLFGPIAGVVVDRADRRRVMIFADVARAALAFGFIVADRLESLPAIYVIGAVLFAVSAFFNAAKRAAIPNIVRNADELLSANSISASTTAATIAVGSALGGLVATFTGRNTVFTLNALTFLVSAEMIRRLRARTRKAESETQKPVGSRRKEVSGERARDVQIEAVASGTTPEEKSPPVRAGFRFLPSAFGALPSASRPLPSAFFVVRRAAVDFWEGLRYVRSEQTLAAIFVVAAVWGLGNGAARALYSIFGARLGEQAVAGVLERPTDFGISVLFVAMGVGGVLGAPLARRFNQASGDGLGARMGRSMTFDGIGLALFSMMPNLWSAAALLVAREMNFAIWWTAQQTIVMKRTDDRYAGRVFASYETLTTLMMLGAMFASGAAADTYGIRVVATSGGIVITFSGVLWFLLRRGSVAAEQTPAARV